MYILNKLQPVYVDDLIRIGRNADGGYVLSEQQIEKTEFLLSFGISNEWSFERDFCKRRRHSLSVYAFDYSAAPLQLVGRALKHLKAFILHSLKCRISRSMSSLKGMLSCLYASISLKRYFRKSKNRFFIPKFLGSTDDNFFCSFDTIFNKLLIRNNLKDSSVFIKMDIEKWEYSTLPQLTPFFDKVNGMAVEFHDLGVEWKNFEAIIDCFSKHFDIIHIHVNNGGKLIPGTTLPALLEITFANKNLSLNKREIGERRTKFPIEGVDFPNIASLPDIPLSFDTQS
ncbi:MAG: hypothetical protein LBB79_06110 [Prevotellaceae bacterium]|nr:hypothetical protein [Prevotellaceae bacterium]